MRVYKMLKLLILLLTLMRYNQAGVIYTNDKLNVSEAIKVLNNVSDNVQVFLQITDPEQSDEVKILSKKDWSGKPSTEDYTKLNLPVHFVIIVHTATKTCNDQQSCSSIVRSIQDYHMGNNWIDIGYNFLIGGDGSIFHGRGWDNQGSFARNYNNKAIGIAFIGNFNDVSPTVEQANATQRLIEVGVQKHFIAEDYKIFGHRQVSNTMSPGNSLYEIIKTWPHWSSTIEN